MQDLNPNRDIDPPIPASYPEALKCPLISSPTTFTSTQEVMGLSQEAAEILDDIRFLTLCVTSPNETQASPAKIRSTASWLHGKLEILPLNKADTEESTLLTIIHTTALLYTHTISTLSPFMRAYPPASLTQLLSQVSSVPLSRWKAIPGIFFWILLVAAPSAGNDCEGRWLKKKMAVTGMTIGMSDFRLAIAYLRAFWKVQRWVARERERAVIDPGILRDEEGLREH